MRRRLLSVTLLLLSVVLSALLVPLLTGFADSRTNGLYESRLAAATRFAALAVAAANTDDPASLQPDLERYHQVFGAEVWVTDADQQTLAASDPGSGVTDPAVRAGIAAAVDGEVTAPQPAAWPWRTRPMVVATPIGRDGQVLGSVVLVQPTDQLRREIAIRILWVTGAGLAALALIGWLVGAPLVAWIVLPVEKLEAGARRIAGGDAQARVDDRGPPELRSLARAFNAMAASVQLSQQQQRDLIADVSHQLSNPMTALRIRLEMLAEDVTEDLEPVLHETERMARTLEAMVEVSRAGSRERHVIEVDLTAQLHERLTWWQPLYGELLEWHLPARAPARVEEDLAAVLIDSLIDNAMKYAPGAPLSVSLEAEEFWWRITVRDHGPEGGPDLSAEEVASLGRRFHRLSRHEAVEGTGLGLAILAGRLHDAEGTLAVEAARPGLRVVIRIPRHPDPGSSAPRPGAGQEAR